MDPTGLLYAVDPYPVGRLGISFQQRIARRELDRVSGGHVEWLRMSGAEAAHYIGDERLGSDGFRLHRW